MPTRLIDTSGAAHDVSDTDVDALIASGWSPPTTADTSRLATESAREQDYGGVAGIAKASAYGLARGVTLGLSDPVFKAAGASAADLKGLREQNPGPSLASEIVGNVAPTLFSGGAFTPTGAISKIGREIAESGGESLAGKVGAAAIGAGLEGTAFGGGEYITQTALENKPLSAEGFVASMGNGALFGAPVGGALAAGGHALQGARRTLERVRKLIPTSEATQAAAQGAHKTAASALADAVNDGATMETALKRRMAIEDSKIGMANAETSGTRAMFGGADADAIAGSAEASAARADMQGVLERYQASRAKLEDWIRAEADPDLEAALSGLRAPDVQTGVRSGPYEAPYWPAEKPSFAVATEAPGTRVIRGGAAAAPSPTPSQAIADETRVGKAIARGTGPVAPVARDIAEGAPRAVPLSDAEHAELKRAFKIATDENKEVFDAGMFYSKGGDELVNPQLRKGGELTAEAAKLRDGLDRGFELPESRLPRDAVLYRGLSGQNSGALDRFKNVKPGDVLEDPAFTSTAFSEKAKSRNEELVFTINAPKGTPALPIMGHFSWEGEMLLPRGVKLRVDKVEYVPVTDRWTIRPEDKVEVLADKSVRFTYPSGATHVQPPIKDIHVTVASEFAPPSAARPAKVGLDAPLEQLSLRQIGEYQNAIDEALKTATGAEKDELYTKWDRAVARRNAITDGKAANPADYVVAGAGKTAAQSQNWMDVSPSKLSLRQLDELQEGINSARAQATPDEIKALDDKWDQAVEHRRAITDGKIANPPDMETWKAPAVAKPQSFIDVNAPIDQLSKSQLDEYLDVLDRAIESAAPGEKRTLFAKLDQAVERKNAIYGGEILDLPTWTPKATTAERAAVDVYTGPEANAINSYLRGKGKLAGDHELSHGRTIDDAVQNLDRLIAKSANDKTRVIYRAVGRNRVLEPGAILQDAAFQSTSESLDVAKRSGPQVIELVLPSGSPALNASWLAGGHESEILLPRGTAIEIISTDGPVIKARLRPDIIPQHKLLKTLDRGMVTTISSTAIAEHGWYEPPGQGRDVEKARRGFKAMKGGQLDPVSIGVTEDGKLIVSDGRNRLNAAVETGRPIRVRWETAAGIAPDDVLKGGAKAAPPASSGDDLLSQLRSTQEALTGGRSLGQLSKSEDVARDIVSLGKQTGKYEDSAMAAEERAMQQEARAIRESAAQPEVPRGADVPVPAQETRAGRRPEFGAAQDTAVDSEMRGLMAGERDRLALERALRKDAEKTTGRTIVDSDIRARMQGVLDDAAVDKVLRKHNGKNVDIGPDVAKAAKVIGDYERANVDMVRLLGDEAPPRAVSHAKDFAAATAKQADAAATSGANAAAAISDKVVPALDAATGGKGSGVLGAIQDVGTAVEVLNAMGINTPSARDIPVIGPLLSMYLKARAALSILGRKGGSVIAGADTFVAGKSADIRNRILKAVDATLDVTARAAGRAGRAATRAAPVSGGAAAILGHALFPGGEQPKSRDPRVLYDARMNDLARAQAPGAVRDAVTDRVRVTDPDLENAIVSQVERGLKFLDSKAPKQTLMPGMIPGDGKWHPSKAALERWSRYVEAVNDPAAVLERASKGLVTIEGAETLKTVYPELFAEAQRMLIQRAPTFQKTLPYSRRVAISILYDVPVDGSMTPTHIQYLTSHTGPAPAAQPQQPAQSAPATTGPLNIGQQTMTALDQRAGA